MIEHNPEYKTILKAIAFRKWATRIIGVFLVFNALWDIAGIYNGKYTHSIIGLLLNIATTVVLVKWNRESVFDFSFENEDENE